MQDFSNESLELAHDLRLSPVIFGLECPLESFPHLICDQLQMFPMHRAFPRIAELVVRLLAFLKGNSYVSHDNRK